VLRERS